MSLGIGLFTRDTAMKFYDQGLNLSRAAVDGIVRVTNTISNTYQPSILPNGNPNPYLVNDTRGGFEDFSWVL